MGIFFNTGRFSLRGKLQNMDQSDTYLNNIELIGESIHAGRFDIAQLIALMEIARQLDTLNQGEVDVNY